MTEKEKETGFSEREKIIERETGMGKRNIEIETV